MMTMRMFRVALLLTLLAGALGPVAAEAQGLQTRPTLLVAVNQSTFAVGQTLTATVGINNQGWPGYGEIYVGLALPDGALVFFTSSGVSFGTAQPLAVGVDLSAPFSVTLPSFFTYQWTGTEPRGTYVLFMLFLPDGALDNGSLGPGETIASATTSFAFP
jgi:hypothetical protein